MAEVDVDSLYAQYTDSSVPFPQTGKPATLDLDGKSFISENSATLVEDGSTEAKKDYWGYTDPNLHRRIEDNLIGVVSFSANVSRGQTFTLDPTVDILICQYGSGDNWQELRLGKDYTRLSKYSIRLLSSSQIIPASPDPSKELKIQYSNRDVGHSYDIQLTAKEIEDNNIKLSAMQPNNYNLEIQNVYSYRTTTVHLHDDNLDGGPGSGETEIP